MASNLHSDSIEEISREIQSRGMEWMTKKEYPVWLSRENSWGFIDVVGFKRESSTTSAEVEGYEIEYGSSNEQQRKNREKLDILKSSFPTTVKVHTCQINAGESHIEKCPKSVSKLIFSIPKKQSESILFRTSYVPKPEPKPISKQWGKRQTQCGIKRKW